MPKRTLEARLRILWSSHLRALSHIGSTWGCILHIEHCKENTLIQHRCKDDASQFTSVNIVMRTSWSTHMWIVNMHCRTLGRHDAVQGTKNTASVDPRTSKIQDATHHLAVSIQSRPICTWTGVNKVSQRVKYCSGHYILSLSSGWGNHHGCYYNDP